MQISSSLNPNPYPPNTPNGNALPTTFSLGTVYHFPNSGDVLQMHIHPQGSHSHITIPLRGSFEFWYNGNTRILSSLELEIVDIPFDVEHGFKALENDSYIVNIRKSFFKPEDLVKVVKDLDEMSKKFSIFDAENIGTH